VWCLLLHSRCGGITAVRRLSGFHARRRPGVSPGGGFAPKVMGQCLTAAVTATQANTRSPQRTTQARGSRPSDSLAVSPPRSPRPTPQRTRGTAGRAEICSTRTRPVWPGNPHGSPHRAVAGRRESLPDPPASVRAPAPDQTSRSADRTHGQHQPRSKNSGRPTRPNPTASRSKHPRPEPARQYRTDLDVNHEPSRVPWRLQWLAPTALRGWC
jgi:hypothetical protein